MEGLALGEVASIILRNSPIPAGAGASLLRILGVGVGLGIFGIAETNREIKSLIQGIAKKTIPIVSNPIAKIGLTQPINDAKSITISPIITGHLL
jgi:hypothetical protein